jgi:excisionase family DNA binding protein
MTEQYVPEAREHLRSINELAKYLGITRTSVYRLVASGELKAVRVGQRMRFRPEDVAAYLERDARENARPSRSDGAARDCRRKARLAGLGRVLDR